MRLFVRNHQTVELTDAGRHFVKDARSAVLYAERAVADARAAMQGADEVLHIPEMRLLQAAIALAEELNLFPCSRAAAYRPIDAEQADCRA